MPPAEIKPMADALPWRGWGPPETGRSSAATPYAELEGRYNTPRHRAIFRDAVAILGAPRHLSIHPGGVVISPGLMTDLAPTQLSSKGVVISQFDLETIERLGLVKIDLLGIRGLTVLGDVADAVRERPPHIGKRRLAVLESIPEQDPATADLVRVGATIGCFQIESPGMRSTLKEIEASSIDDLMVALALYRPGPLTGGLKNAFVRRHLGQEPVSHLHPSLEPLLANTYGVILYQEQVLRIAHELAGLSLADADLLRRAMSHFDPGQQMETLKGRFIRGAEERKAVPPETAKMVWDLMAAFAGYGFPKAHAASYAQVSWRLAWCKAHHPAAFMAAVLANWGGYYPQRTYITEARRMELRLRAPHVNYSQPEFSVAHSNGEVVLFMGLSQVRDLTRRTLEGILRKRPFSSLQDFLARVDPRPLEAKNLVQVGAFDGLGTIPTLMRQLESGSWEAGQMPLFTYDVDPSEDWLPEERSAAQEKILGVSVEFHPLELVEEQIAEAGALNTLEAVAQIGHRVRVAGVRQTWRRFAFSREAPLYFMTIEDLEGILEVTIPSHVYRRGKNAISSSKPFIVEGVIETQHNRPEPVLRAERLWEIS
jgi:DNA polymerase III alpha subunit